MYKNPIWEHEGLHGGKIEYNSQENIFTGEVVDSRKKLTFQGDSIETLKEDFYRVVDEYKAAKPATVSLMSISSIASNDSEEGFKNEITVILPDEDAEILFYLSKSSQTEQTVEELARDLLISKLSHVVSPATVEAIRGAWRAGVYGKK